MLHLLKLAVGVNSPDEMVTIQRRQRMSHGPHAGMPYIVTRHFPRRHEELLKGGSLFRVINKMLVCRQQIMDIQPYVKEDNTKAALIVLAPQPVMVVPRPVRPFQGWRYLSQEDAPIDLGNNKTTYMTPLPAPLLAELQKLCLI